MDPHKRITFWLDNKDLNTFVQSVNHFDQVNFDPSIRCAMNQTVVDKTYLIIHQYIENNLIFFNPQDAPLLKSLADRVTLLGNHTTFKDSNENKLHSIANNLKKLNPLRYTVSLEELSAGLPPEMMDLISNKFSLTNIVDIIASGQPIAASIVKNCFLNPNQAELKSFIEVNFMNMVVAKNTERLRAIGFASLKRTQGIILADYDKVIFRLRTFCKEAAHSDKSLEWFSLCIKCLISNAQKNEETVALSARKLILDEIIKFAPANFVNAEDYLTITSKELVSSLT